MIDIYSTRCCNENFKNSYFLSFLAELKLVKKKVYVDTFYYNVLVPISIGVRKKKNRVKYTSKYI